MISGGEIFDGDGHLCHVTRTCEHKFVSLTHPKLLG